MSILHYKCGCKFNVEDGKCGEILCENPIKDIPRGKIDLDIYNLPLDCSLTWKLFEQGYNCGIFQLEKPLGKQWMKKVRPRNIEELSCLIALLRPGALKSLSGDPPKSMAQRYVDRKRGVEMVDDFGVPELREIFKDSLGVLLYQEHAIKIASELAGFNEQEADILRRAIGHKEADTMAKVEKSFTSGCEKVGKINKEKIEEIFGWIRESQKYSFNKSHSVEYAKNSYWSAYCKAHFPLQFYCSYLRNSQHKQDRYQEVNDIVNEVKLMDIFINLPDIRDLKSNFYIQNSSIYFGLTNVKQVGEANFNKLIRKLKETEELLGKKIGEWSWLDYLLYLSPNVAQPTSSALISVGALDFFGESRNEMLYNLKFWGIILTDKEREWIQNLHTEHAASRGVETTESLLSLITLCAKPKKDGGGCSNYKRVKTLQGVAESLANPPYSLKDNLDYIAWAEEEFLGISISCSRVESKPEAMRANCNCKDIHNGQSGYLVLAAQVDRVNEIKIKNKKRMAFITLSDNTCALSDCVCFPDDWLKYKGILSEGNVVLIRGSRSKRGNFVCQQVFQI